jgi:hypothetical protein
MPTPEPVSITQSGLLTRLDILVNLVADRRGLALDPHGRLARAEVRLLTEALELDRSRAAPERDVAAVELLRGLAEAIGLLRDRGDRIEATTLRHPWARLDPDLRAGLAYAAWCHRVPWVELLRDAPEPQARRLRDARAKVLRLLFELPWGVDVQVSTLAAAVRDHVDLPEAVWLVHTITAVFLDPLVALGAAEVVPPPPATPGHVRFTASARTVVGSALIAAGEELPHVAGGEGIPRITAPMNATGP